MNITDEFVWFFGVVENNEDPLPIGRVQVRCFNLHTSDKALLPTAHLPWAQLVTPPTNAAVGDIGTSPTGIVNGSWVFGFFADGKAHQRPFILGTIAGIPLDSPDTTKGFSDPDGFYPSRLAEPDINRLAKNDGRTHQSISFRNLLVDDLTGEPIPNRDSVYPKNHVYESESGHITEFDDTPGANRTLQFHNSGTMEEVHPDGTRVQRIITDNYHIVLGDDYVRVRGNAKVFIDGDSNIYVRNNATLQVDGNLHTSVGGNYTLNVAGNHTTRVSGAVATFVGKNYTLNAAGNHTTRVSGAVATYNTGTYTVDSLNGVNIKATSFDVNSSSGSISLWSAANLNLYYCDDVIIENACLYDTPAKTNTAETGAVISPPYANIAVPTVNYGAERPIYTSPGGASWAPGSTFAPSSQGGPVTGSIATAGTLSTVATTGTLSTVATTGTLSEHSTTLGSLSEKYESNGNPCAIGNDRVGGYSYGSYQIATRVGTFNNFMDYLSVNHTDYYNTLQEAGGTSGAAAGSSTFKLAWNSVCGNTDFAIAQHNFIQSTHYEHSNVLIKRLGIDLSTRSKTLRDVVWSTSVQHGPNTSVFKAAVDAVGSTATDPQLISAIYAERGRTEHGTLVRFKSSTASVQASVSKRFISEEAQALLNYNTEIAELTSSI